MSVLNRIIPSAIKEKIKKEFGMNRTAEYTIYSTDERKLSNRRAIVTGGSGAIGSAICFRLAMEGAFVGVCSRSYEKANVVIENIKRNGGNADALIMDLTDEKSVSEAFKSFKNKYGDIDILVNNAGGSARNKSKLFKDQDYSVIDSVIGMNLRGTMLCTHIALNYLKQCNTSRIVNISSVVALQGKSGMTDYAAAKAGIIGFTRSLAIELARDGITVNSISPGAVSQIVFDKGIDMPNCNDNCLGHRGKTDDVAGAVAWLVSEDAQYVTGQNIVVDGGRTLGLWGEN